MTKILYAQVHRVLPNWLAKPTVVAGDIRTEKVPLSGINYLDEAILQQLRDNGITHLFPGLRAGLQSMLWVSLFRMKGRQTEVSCVTTTNFMHLCVHMKSGSSSSIKHP